jgi:hypothetical protein
MCPAWKRQKSGKPLSMEIGIVWRPRVYGAGCFWQIPKLQPLIGFNVDGRRNAFAERYGLPSCRRSPQGAPPMQRRLSRTSWRRRGLDQSPRGEVGALQYSRPNESFLLVLAFWFVTNLLTVRSHYTRSSVAPPILRL